MAITQSLKRRQSELANAQYQTKVLTNSAKEIDIESFAQRLYSSNLLPLTSQTVDVFQINLGKMCNQTCAHCHVDAGPDRKEIMTRHTMEQILVAIDKSTAKTVDLTGGAPEMNPDFRWFVEQISMRNKHIIVRCNLTIIVANKKYNSLPDFFKHHKIEVVSSLPFYNADRCDAQRGNGVFEDSIKALKMLNALGYGVQGSGLVLNLVYNPSGAFLPASQLGLERQFKNVLKKDFDISFNALFAITNLPISRFLDYLLASGNFNAYLEKLGNAYNPLAAANVMCRNMISIGWDGNIYDCDFNQMLELTVETKAVQHIQHYDETEILKRNIVVNQHCFGCTAGAGSSCGGSVS